MNGLRSFAVLQARVYEFLEQQDESTLQAIVAGSMRLAIAPAGSTPAPTSSEPASPEPSRSAPSGDASSVVQAVRRLESAQQRQDYLSKMTVGDLHKVAKLSGLKGYSKLRRADLIALLARQDSDPAPPPGQNPAAADEVPAPTPGADAEAVASRLRELETEDEGAAYLREQRLDHAGLLAVAAALQLTRVERLRPAELEKRVLKQAIGARRKFAGLRKW